MGVKCELWSSGLTTIQSKVIKYNLPKITFECSLIVLHNIPKTRRTQRAQTSLAEADHYSHILPTVKMLSLGCERLPPLPLKKKKKKKKKIWIITCTTIWVCYHYYGVVLLIYSSYNTQITTKI